MVPTRPGQWADWWSRRHHPVWGKERGGLYLRPSSATEWPEGSGHLIQHLLSICLLIYATRTLGYKDNSNDDDGPVKHPMDFYSKDQQGVGRITLVVYLAAGASHRRPATHRPQRPSEDTKGSLATQIQPRGLHLTGLHVLGPGHRLKLCSRLLSPVTYLSGPPFSVSPLILLPAPSGLWAAGIR